MPLDFDGFSNLRPYLYHLTARQNLARIRQLRELHCAKRLLQDAGMKSHVAARRTDHLEIGPAASPLLIRDQKPLMAGAIAFEAGWDIRRLVEHINGHVFFWPGSAAGTIRSGLNHFERYAAENPVILRIRTDDAAASQLAYCLYNSGAPRCSAGKHSPRGSQTYLDASLFPGTPSKVVEVVAKGTFKLPVNTEFATSPRGPWQALGTAC